MVTNPLSPMRVIGTLDQLTEPQGTIAVMSSGQGSMVRSRDRPRETSLLLTAARPPTGAIESRSGSPSEKDFAMTNSEIDHESRCRAPLPRREHLNATDQKVYDDVTSSSSQLLRGLHGPAGLWLHDPRLAELYLPFQSYLRFGAGLAETVREACILATARECDASFEWAAHEVEAQRVGVPDEVIAAIKYRESTSMMQVPYGTVVQLVREALTEHSVDADTYKAAASLLGVPGLVDLVTLAGTYASTAALLCVFDMQLDDDETNVLPSLP